MLLKNNKKTQKSSHITLNFATDKTTSEGDNKEQLLDFNIEELIKQVLEEKTGNF